MSNILVQNIKHTNNTTSMAIDTSGQVTIRGEGSATTTNLQQGLAKVWCKFNGDSVSGTGDDSFNVTSLSDDGTGDYTVTIANNFSDGNFVHLSNSANYHSQNDSGNTSDSIQNGVFDSSHSRADTSRCFVAGLGDLA